MLDTRVNPTIQNFGYPDSLVADMGHWVVLMRPKQVTLGSLILAAVHPATSFGELPPDVTCAIAEPVQRLERALTVTLGYDKINYLMLMMVDPHVHFHVIPRYSKPVTFNGQEFTDPFWPKPPDLTSALDVTPETLDALRRQLSKAFTA